MKSILLILLLEQVRSKATNEIKLECPHDQRVETGFSHGFTDLSPILYTKGLFTKHLENNCPFDISIINRLVRDVRISTWQAKSTNTDATVASATSFETKDTDDKLAGVCGFFDDITKPKQGQRKAIICYDLSCNQTHCLPTLHLIFPQQFCQSLKQCSINAYDHKILITISLSFCPEGLIIGGNCIVPVLAQSQLLHNHMTYNIKVTCFFEYSMARESLDNKFLEEMNRLVLGRNCEKTEYLGGYVCFLAGYGTAIHVPYDNTYLSGAVVNSMKANLHGEDHDRLKLGDTSAVIAGNLKFVIDSTAPEKSYQGECFTGHMGYTSLYFYPVRSKGKYVTILTKGVIPVINKTTCMPKIVPLVWTGMVEMRGIEEKLEACTMHCIMVGNGATCEAFSATGIFDIKSTTCQIGKTHKYRRTEDQITFTCQDLNKDISVICNGENITVPVKSLIVGQCIYTITSIFSIFPATAHSIATEMCVQGIHGWLTIIIFFTFCFGWLLIPILTCLIINTIAYSLITLAYFKNGARLGNLIKRMKSEFQRTIGNTTCNICLRECESESEYKSHEELCKNGSCPYCMKDIGVSQVLLNEHYNACMLIDRYEKRLTHTLNQTPLYSRKVRKIQSFRYRNRCFILTVWIILLTVESLIWASSAEDIKPAPKWQNTAHGIGTIKLNSDYELDFSVVAGSEFTHKRMLQSPESGKKNIPFTVYLSEQLITSTVQILGNWMDAEINVKSVFHCYGTCKKYSYPWQSSPCHKEVDFEFQSSWGCNPISCPGINSGCTACGTYVDKLKTIAKAYRIITVKYSRKVCYQIGTKKACKTLESNDCLVSNGVKICAIGTISTLQTGMTLVFFGPLNGGALLIKDWCISSCKFGDPGDIMQISNNITCPSFDGTMQRVCRFGLEPMCSYSGNKISGVKRVLETKDSYLSVNLTKPKLVGSTLLWNSLDSSIKDHINIVVSNDIDFEDLAETPCKVTIKNLKIEGAWGSGIGIKLHCEVSLSECSEYLTTIKVCDNAICYGGNVAHLSRGLNTVIIKGAGGHSGSSFKCCHETSCSDIGFKAEAPHLARIVDDGITTSMSYSDGAPEAGIVSWIYKVAEWIKGMFNGNWFVLIIMILFLIISIVLLIFLCPVKKYK
ncbi:glycoprotein [Longquan virus]|uniref:Envelopment polyprotein n=1 Tax=Longquan virus TaxID=1283294 RepID=M9QSR6_9VIRU|nr:glycoprotein [Longquan virus]AGI62342.1 glycoprotein [Longquan virus]AGI62347.1 glycoprotein [Longquan virus]AGI62348.1 glycoprotein [Longquan virus]